MGLVCCSVYAREILRKMTSLEIVEIKRRLVGVERHASVDSVVSSTERISVGVTCVEYLNRSRPYNGNDRCLAMCIMHLFSQASVNTMHSPTCIVALERLRID